MSKALSAAAWKSCLLLATGLTSATVAASVRSLVIPSGGPAITEEPAVSEELVVTKSPAVSEKPAWLATSRQALQSFARYASLVPDEHMELFPKAHAPFATSRHAVETRDTSYGLASYYGHGARTASGEQSNAHDLTAAHRTLPFGTRVRVTNLSTGQAVTVRINDRGPFVHGRIVDVSHSAAEQLGLVGRGVAKVKLDVVD
jgi:rare lipoprotein A